MRLSASPEASVPEAPVHLAVSGCLLGQPVRYDGGHRALPLLVELAGRGPGALGAHGVRLTPLCPEVAAGLGTPRPPMSLAQPVTGSWRLRENESGRDHTEAMQRAVQALLVDLAEDAPEGFVLKARSPSCGVGTTPRGAATGDGLFAEGVARTFPALPRIDECGLADAAARSRFFEALGENRRRSGRSVAPVEALRAAFDGAFGGQGAEGSDLASMARVPPECQGANE